MFTDIGSESDDGRMEKCRMDSSLFTGMNGNEKTRGAFVSSAFGKF
jgi:hypothetical protein